MSATITPVDRSCRADSAGIVSEVYALDGVPGPDGYILAHAMVRRSCGTRIPQNRGLAVLHVPDGSVT